jgi:hypothetical protein
VLTDCKEGSDRGTIVHASELQVFGDAPTLPQQPTGSNTGTGTGTGTTTGSTGTTGTGTTTPATTTRSRPTVALKVLRKFQTSRNKAPRLVIAVLSDSAAPRAGRLVVVVDGEKWKTLSTTTGRRKVLVTKRLLRGRHTVRVRFRPADRAAYRPARSHVKRIVVRRW